MIMIMIIIAIYMIEKGILIIIETMMIIIIAIKAVGYYGIKDYRNIPIYNLLLVYQNSIPIRRNIIKITTISTSNSQYSIKSYNV